MKIPGRPTSLIWLPTMLRNPAAMRMKDENTHEFQGRGHGKITCSSAVEAVLQLSWRGDEEGARRVAKLKGSLTALKPSDKMRRTCVLKSWLMLLSPCPANHAEFHPFCYTAH
jgi:hypothetical protein